MSIETVHSQKTLIFMCGGYLWQFKKKEVITTDGRFTFIKEKNGIEHVATNEFISRVSVVDLANGEAIGAAFIAW